MPAARLAGSWRMHRSPHYLVKFISCKLSQNGRASQNRGRHPRSRRRRNHAQRITAGGCGTSPSPGNNDHDFYVTAGTMPSLFTTLANAITQETASPR
jgi:hypothetical protein